MISQASGRSFVINSIFASASIGRVKSYKCPFNLAATQRLRNPGEID